LFKLILFCRNLSSFFCSELKKAVADETTAKEAVHIVLTATQAKHVDLEQTVVAVCQELEGEGASSGSSVASRLRSLGVWLAERIKTAFRLGVQRALAVASTHYDIDLKLVSSGYVVAPIVVWDAATAAIDEADAGGGGQPVGSLGLEAHVNESVFGRSYVFVRES